LEQQTLNQNRTTERMDIKFDKLQAEFTSQSIKTDQANKMLQTDVRQLVEGSQKMQADIRWMTEKMLVEVQVTQSNLKWEISEMRSQMNDIQDTLLSILEAREKGQ
jgi:hypothetical protein